MVLNGCKRADQRDAALQLFGDMRNNHAGAFQPDVKSYHNMLNLYAKLKPLLPETALEIIDSLETDDQFQSRELDIHCVALVISACGHAGKLDPILHLLKRVGIDVLAKDVDVPETK